MQDILTPARTLAVQAARSGDQTVLVVAHVSRVGRSAEARLTIGGVYFSTLAGRVLDVLTDVNTVVDRLSDHGVTVRLQYVLVKLG